MLILHAAVVQGNLVLWAEDSDSRNGLPERQPAGEHPHCARARLLTEAIGLETGDNNFASAIAWLPTLGDAPMPSSPMAGGTPRSRAKPRIRPWTVETLRPEAGAGRDAAAGVPRAAGPETRGRHRNGPGLLDPRPAAGGLHDGPATIPAQPGRTGRADRGGMDSGVHRRGRPPAGRVGGTDAAVGQGAHRVRGHRPAGHRGPSSPPGVPDGPGRPPGTCRRGIR